jgi:very-short-patch-repair endonuclease
MGLAQFKARARRLRTTQSNAEARLWHALRNRRLTRYKFRRQYPIDRYIVDFVSLDAKLTIEVDAQPTVRIPNSHTTQSALVLWSYSDST